MDIDFKNLALAEQVLDRQKGHAQAIGQHLETYARLNASEMGLILQLFKPISDSIVDAGISVTDFSGRVFDTGTTKMRDTQTAYQQAEEAAHQAMAPVAQALGTSLPQYSPSPRPSLGGAMESAPDLYAQPDGSLFEQAFKDGYSAAEWVSDTANGAKDRFGDAFSGSRTVSEAIDVRSFLPRPIGDDPQIESIRWSAGPIFGGIDWLFEELVGYSLLEEITKPFVGDWERMREAQFAWTHSGDAMNAIGRNAMALMPAMSSWTGQGSEAFLASAAVVSKAHIAAATPTGTIASAIKLLIMLCKEVVGKLLKFLDKLAMKLLRIASAAAVPIAGWIVAAIDAGISVYEIIQDVRWAYKWVNRIYDLVSGMTANITATAENAFLMADLYESLVRGSFARV